MKTPLDNDLNKVYEAFNQNHNHLRQTLMASLPTRSKQRKSNRLINLIQLFIGGATMKIRITKLAAAAVIIIAVILGLNFIGGPSKSGLVFADVVQRIRKARTVTFTTEIKVGEQVMLIENTRKEPGLKRALMPGGLVLISDLAQKKSITINHSEKQYTERDLENAQIQDFFEDMRTFPDRANEVLPKEEMDGRIVQAFRVIEHGINAICWIDVQTGDLIRIEGQFPNAPNTRIVATDFKFDVELDDALFSLIPPDGYAPKEPPKIDRSEVNCQDLINLLRWWATNTEGHFFPPSLEPAEFRKAGMEMKKTGKISEIQGTKDEKMQHMMKLTRGLQFVMMMKPENDWHYAGKGVELGDADTAICWYRPQGSQTYRVIYGDLSVKDVAPENLPK
jgi:outer membrane lipoprotein-sorting protein